MADATTILRELVEAMQMKERRLGGGVISGRPVALFGWFKDDIEAAYQRAAEHVAGVIASHAPADPQRNEGGK